MGDVENLTVKILQEIRDEMRGMREEMREEMRGMHLAQDQTNGRLDRMQSELVYIRRDLMTRATAPEVDDLQDRVVKLEKRMEKLDPAGSSR